MMASIRLFGRGKNTAGTGGGTAVAAEQIAELLAGLQTASMSTTWRCRHGSGTAIGEGAVDFGTGRSRSTVIRGKYAFEYVRAGSSVYRAVVDDEEVHTQLGTGGSAAAPALAPRGRLAEAVVDDADDDEDEDLEADADADAELDETESEGAHEAENDDDADDADAEDALSQDDEKDADAPVRAWQTFSEHDACGVHAYAEPAVLAAGVLAATAVTPAGRQEFDGRVLTGYAVTLKPKPADPDRLLARLARQLRDHGANTLVVTAFVDESDGAGAAVPDFSGSSAAGGTGGGGPRIERLRLELAHWTPADDPTADHAVTVDLFEFGDPVEVEVPSAGTTRRTMRSCADLALF